MHPDLLQGCWQRLLLLLLLLQVSVGCPAWMAWASLWGLMLGGACEPPADWGAGLMPVAQLQWLSKVLKVESHSEWLKAQLMHQIVPLSTALPSTALPKPSYDRHNAFNLRKLRVHSIRYV